MPENAKTNSTFGNFYVQGGPLPKFSLSVSDERGVFGKVWQKLFRKIV
jgi:hypothetical protein